MKIKKSQPAFFREPWYGDSRNMYFIIRCLKFAIYRLQIGQILSLRSRLHFPNGDTISCDQSNSEKRSKTLNLCEKFNEMKDGCCVTASFQCACNQWMKFSLFQGLAMQYRDT